MAYQHPRDFVEYGDNSNSSYFIELITVNVKIFKQNFKNLIDIGWEISLISGTIMKELKLEHLTFKIPKNIIIIINFIHLQNL